LPTEPLFHMESGLIEGFEKEYLEFLFIHLLLVRVST
jgi:hypothetical protein